MTFTPPTRQKRPSLEPPLPYPGATPDSERAKPPPLLERPNQPKPNSVASILENNLLATIQYWTRLVENDDELSCVPLSPQARAGHLPHLFHYVISRLGLPTGTKAAYSIRAREHGETRRRQGYTPAMIVEESRILEVSIFTTLQKNSDKVDFSKVLLDIMTIVDECDSQLKQAILGYYAYRATPTKAS